MARKGTKRKSTKRKSTKRTRRKTTTTSSAPRAKAYVQPRAELERMSPGQRGPNWAKHYAGE